MNILLYMLSFHMIIYLFNFWYQHRTNVSRKKCRYKRKLQGFSRKSFNPLWRPVYVQCTYAPSSQSALFLVMLGTQRICHRPCSPKTDQHSFWWKIFLALSCIEPVLSGPIEFSEKFFKSNWCHETFGLLLQVNNLQKVFCFHVIK